METLEQIKSRIHIGNMSSAYGLLGKPGVFYVGSGGKGVYAPPSNREKVMAYDASPLGNPFPVHRRDGKSLTDSHGEPIQTYSAEESVEKYQVWLNQKIAKKDPSVLSEINKMANTLLQYKRIALICWCRMFSQDMPACHADVIKDKMARAVHHHLVKNRKEPIRTEKGAKCWLCHQEIASGPAYESKCHYCGAWQNWDPPKEEPENNLELEPEKPEPEPLPKADIDLTPSEHKSVIANLDYEISSTKLILEYLDATHHDAMAHAVQPGAIDLTAHDQAWKVWRDRQNVADKLNELQVQFMEHTRYLIRP